MTTFNKVDGREQISAWVKYGLNKESIDYAEEFGKWLQENQLTTTQIRNIYGEVKRIQMKDQSKTADAEILLLRPKLAYARARGANTRSKDALKSFSEVMGEGINAVFDGDTDSKFERFENFALFFESVIAYHRASGGK